MGSFNFTRDTSRAIPTSPLRVDKNGEDLDVEITRICPCVVMDSQVSRRVAGASAHALLYAVVVAVIDVSQWVVVGNLVVVRDPVPIVIQICPVWPAVHTCAVVEPDVRIAGRRTVLIEVIREHEILEIKDPVVIVIHIVEVCDQIAIVVVVAISGLHIKLEFLILIRRSGCYRVNLGALKGWEFLVRVGHYWLGCLRVVNINRPKFLTAQGFLLVFLSDVVSEQRDVDNQYNHK